jgi:hypothetical protein
MRKNKKYQQREYERQKFQCIHSKARTVITFHPSQQAFRLAQYKSLQLPKASIQSPKIERKLQMHDCHVGIWPNTYQTDPRQSWMVGASLLVQASPRCGWRQACQPRSEFLV